MTDLALYMFPMLLGLIFLGFPVAFSMMLTALTFGLMRFGDVVILQFAQKVDEVATNYVLGAIPLFIFMGAVLERAGIAETLFDAIFMWTRKLPGGLAVAALIMCTIFAAASGVVGATETLVGLLAIPGMMKRGYKHSLVAGTICGGGSLGTIIPPSIPVIVLAPIATLPVGDLLAGIMLPGLMMAGAFILYILLASTLDPTLAPADTEEDPRSLGEKLRFTAFALVPPAFLIFTVLGTLFAGMATPTEAAACGSFGVVLLSIFYRRFSARLMFEAALRTVSLTAMILAIVLAGSMFSGVFFASGGMVATRGLLAFLGLEGIWVAVAILGVTFVMGFAMDLISIVLIMMTVAIPILRMNGIDPLWFSVVFLVTLQTSYLSPPMAPSIFYLRSIAPPEMKLSAMYKGVIPFIVCQLTILALLFLFPGLATWLPKVFYG